MRTIKTTTGAPIALDGDLLAIMEALYQEVTAKRELERSFEDMVKEIHHLIDQMDDGERRTYLAESLFPQQPSRTRIPQQYVIPEIPKAAATYSCAEGTPAMSGVFIIIRA